MFLQSMRGIIERLDGDRFELVILCSRAIVETLRTRTPPRGLAVRPLRRLAAARPIRQVREAACDLIYYWEVGSDAMNYFLPFARLAPVQCTGWGSTITSGVPAVDWFLSSELVEAARFARSSIRSGCGSRGRCFAIRTALPRHAAAARRDFGLPEGRHLYVCFQNPLKLHPDFDPLLAGDSGGRSAGAGGAAGAIAADRSRGCSRSGLRGGFPTAQKPSPPAPLPKGTEDGERIVFLPPQPFGDYCRLAAVGRRDSRPAALRGRQQLLRHVFL